MLLRFTNTAILVLLALLTLTGVYGLFFTFNGWVFDVHRIGGWALIALLPWKVGISLKSLRRGLDRRFDRSIGIGLSLLLAALAVAALTLALMWVWQVGPRHWPLGQTAVSWHWMLALGLLAPLAVHVWRRWPRPKKADFLSRRGALRLLTIGGMGLAGWGLAEALTLWRASPNAPRRYTGSRGHGLYAANDFPVTNNSGEGRERLDAATWRLVLGGAVFTPQSYQYDDLLALPASDVSAALDCTLGWYTTQVWRGVPLRTLLDEAGLHTAAYAVRLQAESGYEHVFPLGEASDILLATHVGDEPLSHWHGYPLRAVVPSRRGWFWVKWLSAVEVLSLPTGRE
jgi:hypothetical protein